MNTSPSSPPKTSTVDTILLNYRSLIADLIQDRHDRGISTHELKAIDDKAKAALNQLLYDARIDELEQFEWNDAHRYVHNRLAELKALKGES